MVFNNGWFCIVTQVFIKVFLSNLTSRSSEWCVVTNIVFADVTRWTGLYLEFSPSLAVR